MSKINKQTPATDSGGGWDLLVTLLLLFHSETCAWKSSLFELELELELELK